MGNPSCRQLLNRGVAGANRVGLTSVPSVLQACNSQGFCCLVRFMHTTGCKARIVEKGPCQEKGPITNTLAFKLAP
eukprot:5634651-Lingulodinium_polyedra.AAC.1